MIKTNRGSSILGKRIYLRPFQLTDASSAYVRWLKDPEICRYLESRPRRVTLSNARAYAQKVLADANTYFFAIVIRDEEEHIGNIKLGPINTHHRLGNIGILIGERQHWGQGYATEAINLLTTFAFKKLRLHKVAAGAYGPNVGSVKAFMHAGYSQEGVRPRHHRIGNKWVDEILLGRVNPTDKSR